MNFKKRMLAGILCLFIIGLQILTMASCGKSKECSHHFGKWFKTKSATCAEEGFQSRRCEHCGEVETSTLEKLEHEWVESTCTAQKTCKNCSAVEGEAKPHSFTVETVKPETLKSVATCTSAAIYYKSCSCGLVSTNPEDVFTNGSALGHIDANKDHVCETCSAAVGECVDANKDHDCDYGCAKTFGEHADGDDADHLCDYGCNKNADEGCYDTVVDGKCDECGAEIGHVCIDDNKDHNCDTCTKTLSQHTDSPKDHICDYCGSELGKCEDANKNHICDYGCDKPFGKHDDGEDTDHLCDYGCKQIADSGCYDFVVDGKCDECGEEIEHTCLDKNIDHKCDICSIPMGDHVDRNFDHVCEYGCNTPIGECKDGNTDHRCDYGCSKIFGTHADSNTDNDHLCDYGCGAKLEESCVDAEGDGNHSCDLCGNVDITLHTFGEATCSAPATCSECGATTGNTLEHLDANFDHKCDYGCGKNDMGVHADSNNDGDHVCDYGCKAILEACSDVNTDGDHACDICGKENVTQHSYDTTFTPANCNDAAKNTYTCDCGHTYDETVGIALGHDVKGVEKQVDGCEYVMEYICQRSECRALVSSETTYHHSHVASIGRPATCKDDGEKVFVCSECGDTSKAPEAIPADPTGHNWIQVGEIANGVRTDECSVCHQTKTVTVYEDVAEDLTASDFENEIEVNNANISLDAGVIDKIGEDTVTLSADKFEGDDREDLGLTKEQLEKQVGDSPIYNFTINNGTENISDFGENNYVTITLPYELSEGEDVDSIAIWFISDKCADETCETENCQDASHRLVSMIATYNNGFVTFKTNHFSYYTVTRLKPAERCALYGHSYSKYEVAGSCTADSYTLNVCIRCHHEIITDLVVADGHAYVESVTQEISCTNNGLTTYTCSDCRDAYTITTFATGHVWCEEGHEDANCVSDGYTKYGCEKCDDEYSVVHAKISHVYTDTVVPVTCTADGYTLHDCDNCEYSYTDSYVESAGHVYEAGAWNWAADYSSATLTFVCKNDAQHVTVVNAEVTTEVVNGSCSVFVRTTYTATVSYNGTEYTDEKVTERGDANHNFNTEVLKKDKNSHWYECICGEKTEVTAHVFENATVTKEPTCANAGQSIAYCVCGEAKKTAIAPTGNHTFDNGFCTECGAEFIDNYYVNLVRSWKNIDGFAIKLQDLSIDINEKMNFLEEFELIGSVKQLNVAELAISFADGEIGGAAIGTISVFNGPIPDDYATYEFKAVIYDGYVYIDVKHDKVDGNYTSMKVSVDSLLISMFEEMDIEGESLYVIDFFKDTVIPAIDTIIDLNADDASKFFENVFNILFTVEKQADGTYVATLDYDKLYALNENLANKPVSEVVDIYFGDGTFDTVVEWIRELLTLELCDIPAYLDEHGLDSEDLIAKINEISKSMGAPDDYDFLDIINDEKFDGITIGMLLFNIDDESYIEKFDDGVEYFRENSLYSYFGGSVESIKKNIDTVIDMLADGANISFTTDATGMLTSVNISADDVVYEDVDSEMEVHITFNLDIIINGDINVTWNNIVQEIESKIVMPNSDMLVEDLEINGGMTGGTLTYKGAEYEYSNGYYIYVYKPDYTQLDYVMLTPNCDGWMYYQTAYSERAYRFVIAPITVDGNSITVIVDQISGETAELVQSDVGFTAIYEDGSRKDLVIDMSGSSDMRQTFANIYFATFEDAEGSLNPMGKYVRYYYNATLNQYSITNQHEYEYRHEFDGDTCEDGRTTYTTCKKCNYSSVDKSTWCEEREYGVEINLSEHSSCGGIINVDRCKLCGKVENVNRMNVSCNMGEAFEEDIVENGKVVGKQVTLTCSDCGLKFVTKEWVEYKNTCEYYEYEGQYIYKDSTCLFTYVEKEYVDGHNYEYTYDFHGESCEDGYRMTVHCPTCGYSYESERRGHSHQENRIDLEDLGLCGGYICEEFCGACGKVFNVYGDQYCSWNYVETDEDGYDVYQCRNCGATKKTFTQTSEKNDKCEYTQTQITRYIVNGEEVYKSEEVNSNISHNYEYTFEVIGDSCLNGYTVVRTCKDCGYVINYSDSGYHSTYTLFNSSDVNGCCDNHYIRVYSCPCGEYSGIDFSNYYFRYDEELQMYVCDDCGLKVSDVSNSVDNGCSSDVTRVFSVYLDDELVYTGSQTKTYENHNFTSVQVVEENGKQMLVSSCSKCNVQNKSEMLTVELEDHNGQYYYDYTFTPDTTGRYNFNVSAENRIRVNLYRVVAGQMINMNSWSGSGFSCETELTAGITYVYRITPYDANYEYGYEYGYEIEYGSNIGGVVVDKNESYENVENGSNNTNNSNNVGKIMIIFGETKGSSCNDCYQDYNGVAILLDGAKTCKGGALYGYICSACGSMRDLRVRYDHYTTAIDRINLSEQGACHGEFIYYSCACGENHRMELNSCAYNSSSNEYYDEYNNLVHVQTRTCSSCGLRYDCSYYTVRNQENCTLTYYYTITIKIGAKLVAYNNYTVVQSSHDFETLATLKNGVGSSCEDGVIITRRCKDCGHEESYESTSHEIYVKEIVDLSALGCVCGGTAELKGCACDYNNTLSRDHMLCDMSNNWCQLWIEDALSGYNYTVNGSNYYGYDSYIYTCAVTDPERCAYKIRYAKYWLKAENECKAYRYETWQFGYNEETGEYLYELTYVVESRSYHDYVDSSTNNHTKYDCPDCGSYYYENNYYDSNNNWTKYELIVSNTLNDGDYKYREVIREYVTDSTGRRYTSRDYEKHIYSDGEEYWYENLRTEEAYSGSFGDPGRKVIVNYTNSNASNYTEEYAYVLYKGYEFRIYTYRTESNGYWYKYDYTYDFTNGCEQTSVYVNSNGERRTNVSNQCRFYNDITLKAPTCTQNGEACKECVVCGKHSESYVVNALDHKWVEISENWYHCFECGLENANGSSGDIIMEDLTEDYGNGVNYVVGYYAGSWVEFTKYVSIILEDGEEIIVPDINFIELTNVCAFAFSKAEVEAWAAANGYTDYEVRFTFVPVGADGSFDYALTFCEPTVVTDTISNKVAFTDYISAGETKSYTITPTEDATWVFTTFANSDTYGCLLDANGNNIMYDDDNGMNSNFRIEYDLVAGETYIVQIRWYNSSNAGNMPILLAPLAIA